MDTSGFYFFDEGSLFWGPNYVLNANFELHRELHETYTYPVYGWSWFDSFEDACASFGIAPDDHKRALGLE